MLKGRYCLVSVAPFPKSGLGAGSFGIQPKPSAPVITTESLAGGTNGVAYSETLAKTGLAGGTWSVAAGDLPSGLSLNATTGEISGTPDTVETANFTVAYTDPYGQADTQALTIEIVSGAYVSPFVAAGFTFFSARDALSKWYTDAGTTLHDGTEDGAIQRITPSAGSMVGYFDEVAKTWKYGSGANAKAINGKPVMYQATGSFSASMSSDVAANVALSGKPFEAIFVVKRDSNYNNKSLFAFGSNAPAACRFYTGTVKAYGFLTGYVEAAASSGVGDQVVHVRFNGTSSKLQIAVNGGAFVEVAETATWSPDTGLLTLGQAIHSIAEFGIYDGNYADYATLVAGLKTEYGIA